MATGAGNLVVHLTAQTQHFERNMQQSVAKTMQFKTATKEMGSVLSGVHPALGTAAGMLAGPAGIATAALAAGYAFKKLLTESEGIVSMADRLGMPTELMEQLQYASERTGVSFEAVSVSWAKMQQEISRASGGGGKADLFRQLGLDPAAMRSQSPEDSLRGIARAISAIDNPVERTRVQMDLFGESGVKLNSVLQMMADGSLSDIAVVSEEARRAMSAAENAWLDFKHETATGAKEIAGGVVLGIGELADNLREMGALWEGGAEGLRDYIRERDRLAAAGADKPSGAAVDLEAAAAENKALEKRANILDKMQDEIDKMKLGADAFALAEFAEMGGDVAAMQKLIDEQNRLTTAKEREKTVTEGIKRAEEKRLSILESLRDEADRMAMGADQYAIRDLEGADREEALRLQEEVRRIQEDDERFRRGRELTREVEAPAETFKRRLDEIERLAFSGDITGETRLRALEQLGKDFGGEEGPTRFSAAMERDSKQAYSAILAAQSGRDDPSKKIAEHTKRSADRLQEMRDFVRELVSLQRAAQSVEIPAA